MKNNPLFDSLMGGFGDMGLQQPSDEIPPANTHTATNADTSNAIQQTNDPHNSQQARRRLQNKLKEREENRK